MTEVEKKNPNLSENNDYLTSCLNSFDLMIKEYVLVSTQT